MLAFCAGEDAAFDALYTRWTPPLQRYLERMVHDRATAEELTQEAWVRVFRARDRYAAEARFSTWLYRIGTNLALNELRRPRRRHGHASTDSDDGPTLQLVADGRRADEQLDQQRLGDRVVAELSHLPDRQRAALWLSAVEGKSYAEVADVLETTEKSVKALVHRGRSALSRAMDRSSVAVE
jgi:RNA polymerase sigma-70 factor (ECF subfamily)